MLADVLLRRIHNVNDLVGEVLRIDRVHATHGLQDMSNTLNTEIVEVFSALNVADEQLGYDFANWHVAMKADFISIKF